MHALFCNQLKKSLPINLLSSLFTNKISKWGYPAEVYISLSVFKPHSQYTIWKMQELMVSKCMNDFVLWCIIVILLVSVIVSACIQLFCVL